MVEKRKTEPPVNDLSDRLRWEEPRLRSVGTVGEVLQDAGEGKCSIAGGDPGESRKPSGGDTCK